MESKQTLVFWSPWLPGGFKDHVRTSSRGVPPQAEGRLMADPFSLQRWSTWLHFHPNKKNPGFCVKPQREPGFLQSSSDVSSPCPTLQRRKPKHATLSFQLGGGVYKWSCSRPPGGDWDVPALVWSPSWFEEPTLPTKQPEHLQLQTADSCPVRKHLHGLLSFKNLDYCSKILTGSIGLSLCENLQVKESR